MSDNTDVPTEEEIAAAQAVMERLAAAQRARIEAALPALKAFAAGDAIATVEQVATELRETVPLGTAYHAHLGAILIGVGNLRTDLARQ